MDALEDNLINLAQDHADWLFTNNAMSHTGENGLSPFQRIDNDPVLGTASNCHDFLTRAENLSGMWTSSSSIPMPIEQAIYGWLYEGTASNWGHRQALLLQDKDLNQNPWGYTNNYGIGTSEGFLGVGLIEATGGTWDPFDLGGWVNAGTLVVLKVMDPASSANCNYQLPASAPGVLPIELVDFIGQLNEKEVDLSWITAMEWKNDFFKIQHSTNGKNFETIGIVEGNGTTEEAHTYQFTHNRPSEGMNYYRLQQVDEDGTSSFSSIVAIRFFHQWSVTIYPNPVVDTDLSVNVITEEENQIKLSIYDFNGQFIWSQTEHLKTGLNQNHISTMDLPKGVYNLVISGKEKSEILKFSKL